MLPNYVISEVLFCAAFASFTVLLLFSSLSWFSVRNNIALACPRGNPILRSNMYVLMVLQISSTDVAFFEIDN